MKIIRNIFDKLEPMFTGDGSLKAFKPLYEAMDNFFFAPDKATLVAPFGRDPLDIKRFMSMVIVALVPALICSVYFFGLRFLAMMIVSYAVGGAVEVAFAVIRKEEINEGFLVTGMLFPMIMPPTLPLWMVGVGVAFGVLVGKELFGGTGRNIFNPAIVGRCFLALAYPLQMSTNWVKAGTGGIGRALEYVTVDSVDAVSNATPLVLAKGGEIVDISKMFLGNISGSIGETSALAIIAGGIFLLMTRVGNWRTVVATLLSAFVLSAIFHNSDSERFAPAMWHLCAGGLLFGAFFMATDPVTSPVTNAGKWFYGIIIGIVTVLIRNFGGYVEGVMFAILLGNIMAPILDEIVFKIRIRRLAVEG
ncbi:MAG: RnfABCDGE type electron transport complex subunit D [Planctomycetes bacterium]|nr:RnfABCDGE type electron transport complex subunit D [Planctomycetota bacterium]